MYIKLTDSFEITCPKLQYIGRSGFAVCHVVIDLGGNTLTYSKTSGTADSTRFFGVYNGSSLTIQNGHLINNGQYTNADGNKTATLNVTTTASNNGYQYRCKLTGAEGSITYTDAAELTVTAE